MRQIGEDLLRVRKARIAGDVYDEKQDGNAWGKDLLSALVRANMDTELPESQRMVDEDVLARKFTFFSILVTVGRHLIIIRGADFPCCGPRDNQVRLASRTHI